MKSDGLPTYHFANVVDDHLMGITHVLRGDEWINSAPKHLLLYQAFGWEPPELCHLPLLRNPDKSKLSKRKNPTSILYYQRIGVLPEALLNYLGRMAWSMPDEREKFSLDEMLEHFDLDRVSLGGPVFEVDKLNWLSGLWMRDLAEDEFAGRVAYWALNPTYLRRIIPLVQSRTNQLSDLGSLCTHFFQGLLNLKPEQLVVKQLQPAEVQKALTWTLWGLDAEPAWTAEAIDAVLGRAADRLAVKRRILLAPVFIAITGKSVSTPLYATMEIIGRDLSRARIQQAIDALGPVGKKLAKRWDKEYRAAIQALAEAKATTDDVATDPSITETP
jgi:glutamyl-tRNA synthetase